MQTRVRVVERPKMGTLVCPKVARLNPPKVARLPGWNIRSALSALASVIALKAEEWETSV
jgi:hypothetical protein